MELWQTKIALEAERAANMCIACGRYGHYPVECPRERQPQLAAPKERPVHPYTCFLWFMIGLVIGLCVMRGLS